MITKASSDYSKFDFQSGEVILIDKPIGWSSFKVVYKIRQAVKVKKVGHAGTLDPLASGLLMNMHRENDKGNNKISRL